MSRRDVIYMALIIAGVIYCLANGINKWNWILGE
jgi:hypothetical protein